MGSVAPASLESKEKKANKTRRFRIKFALIWNWTLSNKEKQPEVTGDA